MDRADSLAEVLDTDRTDVLIDALRDYLRSTAHDDEVKQEIADAYYDDKISFDELVGSRQPRMRAQRPSRNARR